MATNEELFKNIHTELFELEEIVNVIMDDIVHVAGTVSVALPGAVKSTLISRCVELRTSLIADFQALSIS